MLSYTAPPTFQIHHIHNGWIRMPALHPRLTVLVIFFFCFPSFPSPISTPTSRRLPLFSPLEFIVWRGKDTDQLFPHGGPTRRDYWYLYCITVRFGFDGSKLCVEGCVQGSSQTKSWRICTPHSGAFGVVWFQSR